MLSRDFAGNGLISKKEIESLISAENNRRIAFLNRLKMLSDNYKDIFDQHMHTTFQAEDNYTDMKPYFDVSNNLMRRIIREISFVYADEPDREITSGGQKRYEEIVADMNFDHKLERANFLLNGLNDLIIQVLVYDNGISTWIDLGLLTPDKVIVIKNPDNPTIPDAVMIEDSFTLPGDASADQMRKQWIFWSPTRHFLINEKNEPVAIGDNEEMINPYFMQNIDQGMFYPFVFAHSSDRESDFWDKTSGTDLYEATLIMAMHNSFINMMFPMQFKQIYVKKNVDDKGTTIKNKQLQAPLHIFESNAEMGTFDWQTNLTQLTEEIKSRAFSIANNYGMSAENFKLTAQEQSGFSRMIAKEGLLETRRKQIKVWRGIEVELFKAIREANNFYQVGKPISDKAKFSIDYPEMQFASDPVTELDVLERKMDMGLINRLDVIKQENPDIKTDEEALAALQKNVEINRAIKKKFTLTLGQNNDGSPNSSSNVKPERNKPKGNGVGDDQV